MWVKALSWIAAFIVSGFIWWGIIIIALIALTGRWPS